MKLLGQMRFFAHQPRALSAFFRRQKREHDPFDREFNVDTAGIIRLHSLDIQSHNDIHGVRYQGCDPRSFHAALKNIHEDLRDFTFIDLGCGKGRALLLAGGYPFGKLIGVDFSGELISACDENLKRTSKPLKAPVDLLAMDATQFSFPDRNIVLFLFNPFSDKVLAKVLAHLPASRSVYVILLGRESPLLLTPRFKRLSHSTFSLLHEFDLKPVNFFAQYPALNLPK